MFTIDLLMLANARAAYKLNPPSQNPPQDAVEQAREHGEDAALLDTSVTSKPSTAASVSHLQQRT